MCRLTTNNTQKVVSKSGFSKLSAMGLKRKQKLHWDRPNFVCTKNKSFVLKGGRETSAKKLMVKASKGDMLMTSGFYKYSI